MKIVYFSNTTGLTDKLIHRIGAAELSVRIPIAGVPPTMDEEYILVTTSHLTQNRVIPEQVVNFLKTGDNAKLMRGVAGTGSKNFGKMFCVAVHQIARLFNVPVVFTAELFGSVPEVNQIRETLTKNWGLQLGEPEGIEDVSDRHEELMQFLADHHKDLIE